MDFNGNGSSQLMTQTTDPAITAAAESAKAQIQAAYMMALHRPRNSEQARLRILQNCRRPEFAERVEYSKPIGGQKITGASVRFVELALREWGNVRTEIQVIYEDDYVRRLLVSVMDLESNTCFSKQIQMRKTVERRDAKGKEIVGQRLNSYGETVYIVRATDDELQVKENAAVSKIIRNEGLRILPSDIVDEARAEAQKTLRTRDAKDPEATKKAMLDFFFNDFGVEPKDIEAYLGHPTRTISPQEMTELRSMYRAMKDGEAKWADFVPTDADEDATAKTSKATQELKDRLKQQQQEKDTPPAEPQAKPMREPGEEG